MRNLVATAALFLFAATASAQTPVAKPLTATPVRKPVATTGTTAKAPAPKPVEVKVDKGMTNEQVIAMVEAKLSEDVIITAIEKAPRKGFQLEPMDLVALAKCGVSNTIIAVMQGNPRPVAVVHVAPAPLPPTPAPLAVATNAPVAEASAPETPAEDAMPKCKDVKGWSLFKRCDNRDPARVAALRQNNSTDTRNTSSTGVDKKAIEQKQAAEFTVALSEKEVFQQTRSHYQAPPNVLEQASLENGQITAARSWREGSKDHETKTVVVIAPAGTSTTIRVYVMDNQRTRRLKAEAWEGVKFNTDLTIQEMTALKALLTSVPASTNAQR